MRTDNRKVKNTVISVYFILIFIALLMATIFKYLELFGNSSFIVFVSLFALIIIFHSIAGYFEYDSDGAKVQVVNKGLILTEYVNYREKKIEFARNQLVGFKANNYVFYKSLVIMIKDYEGKKTKHRFNITLLTRKKLKYAKQSLNKILKENRKLKQKQL